MTMKKMITVTSLACCISLFVSGCGRSDDKTPSEAEYRAALERKVQSPGGARINIQKELDIFRSSSDDTRKRLYEEATK